MTRECSRPHAKAGKPDCPLQCWWRRGAAKDKPADDEAPARDRVDWAGLPIDLDLVFSREQRDKVYLQHLLRKQKMQLSRWPHGGAQLCVCESAADQGRHPDAADSVSGPIAAR